MKDSKGEKIYFVFNYILLTIAGLSCLLPLMHLTSLSLSSELSVLSGRVYIWPVDMTYKAYELLLKGTRILQAMWNSTVISVVGVSLSLLFTSLAAYPLSRRCFYGRRFFTLAIVFTMLFSGGLIPTYLVINGMNLVNTYTAIWLLGLISPFNMLIMRSYFMAIPEEMEDAAKIDGCGDWRFLIQIILPLSMPVMATIALFYAISYWNSFLPVLIYINDSNKFNLAVLVQNMIKSQTLLSEMNSYQSRDIVVVEESIKAAAIIVMVIPMVIIYPLLQKYFVKGAMIGAIKG